MFLIGLTGGIAAGKTTVAAHWVSLGAIEIDADKLAREVVEPKTKGLNQIVEAFGPQILSSSGELNRKALGEIVFNEPARRVELEAIVHPLVRERAQEILKSLPKQSMVVYTVPLLVEAKVALPFDVIVSVEAPEVDRIQRLIDSRGMTSQEAEARIKAQASPLERAAAADYILNSNQALPGLLADANALWNKFLLLAQENSK
jgi:dephospho-CoA kinase